MVLRFRARLTDSYSLTPWPDISLDQSFVNESLVTVKLASVRLVNGTKVVFLSSSSEVLEIQITDLNTPLIIPKMTNSTNWSDCGETVQFDYYMMAPRQVNGWLVLGEVDKFVPANRQRILSMESGHYGNDLVVKVNGAPGEPVIMSFMPPGPIQRVSVKCVFPTQTEHIGNDNYATVTIYCQYNSCRCMT